MGKRIARTMVMTAALALASLGFAGTAGAEDYRVGFAQPIDTLNPFQAYSSPSYFVYNGVYDLLINFDTATGEPGSGALAGRELGHVDRRQGLDLPPARRASSGQTASRSRPRTCAGRSRPSSTRRTCCRATSPA